MAASTETQPIKGMFWMILTGIFFVCVTALVKILGTRIPAPQAAFLRFLFGLVFMAPALAQVLRMRPERNVLTLATARGIAHTFAVTLWFFAMARIPIADVTAMNYMSPIYVTLGAALFLGERLASRRILAIVGALIGALIILRPGFRELGAGHLAMVVAAVCFGGSFLFAKMLSTRANPSLVVALLSVTVTIGLAPLAAMNWVAPTLGELAILTAVALLATAGHYTMTLAFRIAPLAVTQPATFLQLIWAVAIGALMFGEPVDPWVVFGGLVIVGAVSFIAWRETRLRRVSGPPPAP